MSAFTYTHTQALSSNNWTVQHNLSSRYVNIDVIVLMDGKYQTIWPKSVSLPDANTATVIFSSPMTGFVRVGA
jgi:hypothetical protein